MPGTGRRRTPRATHGSSAPTASGAFVRLGSPGSERDVPIRPGRPGAAPPAAAAPSGRALEAELAERLDTVLGIAGRLAASHDRADLFRMIVDETKRALRADATTIRVLRDDRLEVAAWAGLPDDAGQARCRSSVATRAGSARSCAPATSSPARTSATIDRHGDERVRRRLRGRRPPDRAADPPRPGASAPCRRSPASRAAWTSGDVAFITTLATHAAIALDQRRAVRADRGAGRPARGPPGRLGADEPRARRSRRSAGRSSRRRAGSSTTTTPGSTSIEPPDEVVPIAFEGTGRRLRARRHGAAPLQARRGLHRLGRASTASRSSSTTPTATRAARRSPGPTTSTNRCSSCRCATTA